MKHMINIGKKLGAALAAAFVLATGGASAADYTPGPWLPATNFTVDVSGNVASVLWDDFRDLAGVQVWASSSLDPVLADWQPLVLGRPARPLDGTRDMYPLSMTAADFDTGSPMRFFRLRGVRGPARAEIVTVITMGLIGIGHTTNHYVEVDAGVYIKTDEGGKPKLPITYWRDVTSSGIAQVYPDGKGGWSSEFVCLCACPGCTCNLPSYPVDNSITWDKVDHTLRIDLADYTATKLPANYDVRSDGGNGKTNYLYFRYILPGSFTMGSPHLGYNGATETEFHRYNDRETQTVATFNSGFYIGVYEVTIGQYNRIMKNASSYTDTTVRHSIKWDTIRGGSGVSPLAAPAIGSVLGKLQYGVTNNPANSWLSNFTVDLPTEAQWE
jgi:hypothetical protein